MSENRDLLNELASSEDEFDVDLMAAGCRLVPSARVEEISPAELIGFYDFDQAGLVSLIEGLVSDGKVDMGTLYQHAERVSLQKGAAQAAP
ncbi:hypothetical protein [Actinosynnema sp. ALI-1.44]|uniref:hypothetical protein n=1 Tax=Actinosynnema sp. ALI-1.44 TaxID=1933779 RepID=UPI00097BD42E|nr:hypothetical protein [Actinosynnema sp. ALI-1.44]